MINWFYRLYNKWINYKQNPISEYELDLMEKGIYGVYPEE